MLNITVTRLHTFKVGVIILLSETASLLGVSTVGFSIQDKSMDVFGTVFGSINNARQGQYDQEEVA